LLREKLDETRIAIFKHLHDPLGSLLNSCIADQLRRLELCQLFQCRGFPFLDRTTLLALLAYVCRQVARCARIQARRLAENLEIPTRHCNRSETTDEVHPQTLFHLFRATNEKTANLSGALSMRPAAGIQIKITDVHQTNFAGALREFAYSHLRSFFARCIVD